MEGKLKIIRIIFVTAFFLCLAEIFFVMLRYTIIEASKPFDWTIKFALPISIILALFFNKSISLLVKPQKWSETSEQNFNILRFIMLVLTILIINFLVYNSLILTNEFFGKKTTIEYNSKIVNVNKTTVLETRKSSGHTTFDIQFNHEKKPVSLMSYKEFNVGDTFDFTLSRGCWGILYSNW